MVGIPGSKGRRVMQITAQTVKELRDRTGAGIMDCRKALTETEGNIAKAEALLREKGMRGPKDPTRATKQGLIESYKHPGGQLGSLVELNCETDFVARTDDFRQLAYEIALHVAATDPKYIDRESIPDTLIDTQKVAFAEQLRVADTGEAEFPAKLDARIEQWIQEVALLEQPYVRDPKHTIRQLILATGGKTGENIRIGRFARFKVGE
jgi:elongation factor Ts